MNKESFIQVLRNPKSISAEQLANVEEVVDQYPYFQIARSVIACGSRSLNREDAKEKLAKAAIYTTNRQLLKKYVSGELSFDIADHIQIGIHRETQTKSIPSAKGPSEAPEKKVPKFRIIERKNQHDDSPTGSGKFKDVTKKEVEEDIDEELTIIDDKGVEQTTVTHTSIQTAKEQKDQADKDAAELAKAAEQRETEAPPPTENEAPSEHDLQEEQDEGNTDEVIVTDTTEEPSPKLTSEALVEDVLKNLEAYKHSRNHYFEVEQKILSKQESDAIDDAIKKANTKIKKDSKESVAKKPKPVSKAESTTPAANKKTTSSSKAGTQKKKEDTGAEAADKKSELQESDDDPHIEMRADQVDNNIIDQKPDTHSTNPKEPVDKKEVQKEIIERFIKSNPKILPADEEPKGEIDDLSTASAEMKDDFATENLAVILARQGKREKAIEIYEKLILKIPKKKSYFAARIAELK